MNETNLSIELDAEDSLDVRMTDDALEVEMQEGIPLSNDDYNSLRNKPRIEGVMLEGDKTYEELNMHRLTNIEIENILN